jgi:hypothetical protein
VQAYSKKITSLSGFTAKDAARKDNPNKEAATESETPKESSTKK